MENLTFSNNSFCINVQDRSANLVDKTYIRFIFGLLYSFVWLIGVLGNILVFYSLGCRKVSLGVHSHLIFSLACSDLLIGFSSLPVTGIGIFSRIWVFGQALCYAVPFLQGGSIFVSSFTLAVIAIDRYRTIGQVVLWLPFWLKFLQITLIWGLGFFAAVPHALVMQIKTFNDSRSGLPICGEFCHEIWSTPALQQAYGTLVICVQLILPFLVLIFCYNRLRQELLRSTERRLSYPDSMTEARRKSLLHRSQKTLRIVILVCLAFFCSWLPLNILNILRDYGKVPGHYTTVLFAAGHLIAMASIVWNPLIYGWMNDEFKAEFQAVLSCDFSKNGTQRSGFTKNRNNHEMRQTTEGREGAGSRERFLSDRNVTYRSYGNNGAIDCIDIDSEDQL